MLRGKADGLPNIECTCFAILKINFSFGLCKNYKRKSLDKCITLLSPALVQRRHYHQASSQTRSYVATPPFPVAWSACHHAKRFIIQSGVHVPVMNSDTHNISDAAGHGCCGQMWSKGTATKRAACASALTTLTPRPSLRQGHLQLSAYTGVTQTRDSVSLWSDRGFTVLHCRA